MSPKSKKTRRELGLVVAGERLLAGADDAQPGREHQALLRPGDGEVDAPLVHAEVDAPDRAHPVDHEQRRMLGVVQRLAHARHVAGDTGGGLVVGEEHRLDLVPLVRREGRVVPLDRRALTPLGVEDVHLEAEPLGHVDPQMTELPEPAASTRSPGERVLHSDASQAPVPLAGKMKGWPRLGLEDLAKVPEAPASPGLGNADERWSSIATCIARRMRSGVLVGPGTKRKLRPGIAGPLD